MLNKDRRGFYVQNWQQAVQELSSAQTDYVLITLLGTGGSTPRAAGTKMVVTKDSFFDTVGGGHLEYQLIARARQLLTGSGEAQTMAHFPLGSSLGQCCGGSVSVLFERMVHQGLALDIYGAGHVAQALIPLLGQLPVRVRWIDSRADLFPESVPANVQVIVDEEPTQQVRLADAQSAFLILTHNHQLDFALTETVLKRGDARFLGVIGSQTKAKRFRLRLQHKHVPEQVIECLTCPVGLSEVSGKRPMEVAVSICGQIIALYQRHLSRHQREGLQWKTLTNELDFEEAKLD